ncbi:MAG: sigma-70 family RNA polymerase sigma factor [Deltaproteobacteria bacterium]|nr:sigma-70 family RNA polymerase sigma factor [Deltaproteobacteria bacterium]
MERLVADAFGLGSSAVAPKDARERSIAANSHVSDWRAFYSANWRSIARFLRRLGGSQIDVEEATQDVFLVLAERMSEFRGDAEMRTWIYRICFNVASEHRRRLGRVGRLADAWKAAVEFFERPKAPDAQMESRDEAMKVGRALARMKAKKREILVLCELEGLSADEVARVLEIPISTVRTRLFYARRAFAKRLMKEGDAP